jgi:AbrB family looped-hinge helix DNA binding protein
VVIPAEYRHALGIRPGDQVRIELQDGHLRLSTREMALKWAQERVRRYVPAGVSLADELIRERREEAARE